MVETSRQSVDMFKRIQNRDAELQPLKAEVSRVAYLISERRRLAANEDPYGRQMLLSVSPEELAQRNYLLAESIVSAADKIGITLLEEDLKLLKEKYESR
jgi:hypothetical protein